MSVKTQGCILYYFEDPPKDFVAIANVTSFQGPSGSYQVIDTTRLVSTAKDKTVSIIDSGQLTFDFNFDAIDTILITIWGKFVIGSLEFFRITLSDGTWFEFSAYILNFNYTVAADDIVRGSVTLEVTGTVTASIS